MRTYLDNVKENFRNKFKARNPVCMEESAVDTEISVCKTSWGKSKRMHMLQTMRLYQANKYNSSLGRQWKIFLDK